MSGQLYSYSAHFTWKWTKDFDAWAVPDETTLKGQLNLDFDVALTAEIAQKLGASGHWFKLGDSATKFTNYSAGWAFGGGPIPIWRVNAEGETFVNFQSDVKDANAHNSPQLWGIIQDSITQLIAWLGDHPAVVMVLLTAGILTILAVWLINTTTGAISKLGSNAGSLGITLGILALAGLVTIALFFTSQGRKATSKGYHGARRIYQRALPAPSKRRRR